MRSALLVATLLAGCAHDVHAHFPTPAGEPPGDTGSLTLVLTRSSPDVYVAIDGVLVVNGANTKHIHVDGLPGGYASVAIAMGEGEKAQQVWIEPGRDTVMPVPSPGGSPVDSLRNMALSLAAVALYAWIR